MIHQSRFVAATILVLLLSVCFASNSFGQLFPFQQQELVRNLDNELSGESAKRNLEYLSRLHRMRGSEDYQKATEFIQSKLNEYHLEQIELFNVPADGKIMYGTQKSRPAWDVKFAELWEMENKNEKWQPLVRIANWEAVPLVLAQDSESGEATADLVDIGSGTSDHDYANKNIKGNLVLTSSHQAALYHWQLQNMVQQE